MKLGASKVRRKTRDWKAIDFLFFTVISIIDFSNTVADKIP
jgi:hypothetical protein